MWSDGNVRNGAKCHAANPEPIGDQDLQVRRSMIPTHGVASTVDSRRVRYLMILATMVTLEWLTGRNTTCHIRSYNCRRIVVLMGVYISRPKMYVTSKLPLSGARKTEQRDLVFLLVKDTD